MDSWLNARKMATTKLVEKTEFIALLLHAHRLIITFIQQDVVLGGVFYSAQNQNEVNGLVPVWKDLALMTGQQRTMTRTSVWVEQHQHNSNNTFPFRHLSYRPTHSHLDKLA